MSVKVKLLALAAGAALPCLLVVSANADETFAVTQSITVPGGLNSFDIGFVDPQLGLYFLADRTNATVDEVVTSSNPAVVSTQLAKGQFAGVKTSSTSGPNGVITANSHKEVWAADGDSTVKVIDLGEVPPSITHTIKTGTLSNGVVTQGQKRADELCEDPQHHLVLVANDEDVDRFIDFISTDTYKVVGSIEFKDGKDPNGAGIIALNGIEQCQWDPRTKKFYLNIPQAPLNGTGTPGANDTPGVVLEINPGSMKVEKVFPIDFGFVAASTTPPAAAKGDCLGPQGMAIGPNRQILLGCSNSGAGSVIINELDGSLIQNLPGLNGNDEVWYNPGDNQYFLAGSNHTGGPILGVVDENSDQGSNPEDASATTKSGSHSVAADPVNNQVYVPVNSASASLCGTGSTTGCIAVFTTTGDDPGLCLAPGARTEEMDNNDQVFLRTVCEPGTNVHAQSDH